MRISDKTPAFVIPTKDFDHRFIIGQDTDVVYLIWPYDLTYDNYFAECLIATVDYDCQGNLFNDAKADAYGRIWSGKCNFVSTSQFFVVFNTVF